MLMIMAARRLHLMPTPASERSKISTVPLDTTWKPANDNRQHVSARYKGSSSAQSLSASPWHHARKEYNGCAKRYNSVSNKIGSTQTRHVAWPANATSWPRDSSVKSDELPWKPSVPEHTVTCHSSTNQPNQPYMRSSTSYNIASPWDFPCRSNTGTSPSSTPTLTTLRATSDSDPVMTSRTMETAWLHPGRERMGRSDFPTRWNEACLVLPRETTTNP